MILLVLQSLGVLRPLYQGEYFFIPGLMFVDVVLASLWVQSLSSHSKAWFLHDTIPEFPFAEAVVTPLYLLGEAESSLAY